MIILGDLNVHVDDISSPSTNKFLDILATHKLVPYYMSLALHINLVIRLMLSLHALKKTVSILSVDPPLLSDHAFVVAEVECTTSQGNLPTDMRTVRNWRSLDVDMLVSDLCSSGSVATG